MQPWSCGGSRGLAEKQEQGYHSPSLGTENVTEGGSHRCAPAHLEGREITSNGFSPVWCTRASSAAKLLVAIPAAERELPQVDLHIKARLGDTSGHRELAGAWDQVSAFPHRTGRLEFRGWDFISLGSVLS